MAKLDFCFTFYDGDATRDMAHMNRLERGAYIDIIIQIRQKGHLSKEQIKMFLSKDFEAVWAAMEWVLKVDAEGRYFLDWLENSLEESKKHSKRQKDNVEKRYQNSEVVVPNGESGSTKWEENKNNGNTILNSGSSLVVPLKDEQGDESVLRKEGVGENHQIQSSFTRMDIDLLLQKVLLDQNFKLQMINIGLKPETIEPWLEAYNRFLKYANETMKQEKEYRFGFPGWLKKRDITSDPANYQPVTKQTGNGTAKNWTPSRPAAAISGKGGY